MRTCYWNFLKDKYKKLDKMGKDNDIGEMDESFFKTKKT